MSTGKMALAFLIGAFALASTHSTFAQVGRGISTGSGSGWGGAGYAAFEDPPGRFFPGKYYEYKANFYLRKKDYSEALRLFELSGFWADKVSQYNAGIMHYNGIGVPQDRIRGVAWLGIAAENRDDLANKALQTAYASLTSSEREDADRVWQGLNAKYGDNVAIPRALKNFRVETGSTTGGHPFWYFGANALVQETGPDSGPIQASDYFANQNEELEALVSRITGHVTVGAVRIINVSADAKQNASQEVLAPLKPKQ